MKGLIRLNLIASGKLFPLHDLLYLVKALQSCRSRCHRIWKLPLRIPSCCNCKAIISLQNLKLHGIARTSDSSHTLYLCRSFQLPKSSHTLPCQETDHFTRNPSRLEHDVTANLSLEVNVQSLHRHLNITLANAIVIAEIAIQDREGNHTHPAQIVLGIDQLQRNCEILSHKPLSAILISQNSLVHQHSKSSHDIPTN